MTLLTPNHPKRILLFFTAQDMDDAVGAFRPPPLVGLVNQLRALFGVRSTTLGSVDVRSGSFVPNEIFNGGFSQANSLNKAIYYGHEAGLMAPDVLFGVGRLYMANAQGQIYEAQSGAHAIGKKQHSQ